MALNFVVAYTFSPSTTISSSQVNTNTSDVAGVFQGLEAETKSLAKLKVDIDPTVALEVATKQYVDHYSTYRRPVLVYNSTSVVNIETGLNGTSGAVTILFPDGNLRSDSTTGRVQCNLAQVAALSGSAQGGLQSGAAAANTWYMIYAVKVTDSSTNFVAVADLLTPVQANYAGLNSHFGTNSWVYIGSIVRGDVGTSTTDIVSFVQIGNTTVFNNAGTGANVSASAGIILGTTGGATTLTYTYAAGVAAGSAQLPGNITSIYLTSSAGAVASSLAGLDAAGSIAYFRTTGSISTITPRMLLDPKKGFKLANGASSSITYDILLAGFVDGVLGVGSNPLL